MTHEPGPPLTGRAPQRGQGAEDAASRFAIGSSDTRALLLVDLLLAKLPRLLKRQTLMPHELHSRVSVAEMPRPRGTG